MLTLTHLDISIGDKPICRDLSVHIGQGERWAVLGINGVGKTTLLHTLTGLRAPQRGSVTLAAVSNPQVGAGNTAISQLPARERARRIGLMSQDDDFAAETRVLDAVLLGRLPHLNWWRGETTQDLDIARTALREVGLDASFEPRLASTLSGGERRRVALATLLAQAVPLLILDEPTTHLDLHQQIALLDLLAGLSGHTVIMSLHDVNLAARYCTHTLLIFGDGQCCAGPTATMLTADVLSRLYRHRVEALPTEKGPVFMPA